MVTTNSLVRNLKHYLCFFSFSLGDLNLFIVILFILKNNLEFTIFSWRECEFEKVLFIESNNIAFFT